MLGLLEHPGGYDLCGFLLHCQIYPFIFSLKMHFGIWSRSSMLGLLFYLNTIATHRLHEGLPGHARPRAPAGGL